jgi:hypothetical protein
VHEQVQERVREFFGDDVSAIDPSLASYFWEMVGNRAMTLPLTGTQGGF